MASSAIISGGTVNKPIATSANRGVNASGFETKDGLDSIYGVTIPLYFGRARCRGYIIYARKTGSVSLQGDAIFAVAFGKPASNAHQVVLTKIWLGGTLIMNSTDVAGAASSSDFTYTFYDGSEDQLPDPSIVSLEGAGNVPAFRGLMYLVIKIPNYSNSRFYSSLASGLPLIEAEIAQAPKSNHRMQSLGGNQSEASSNFCFADLKESYFYVMTFPVNSVWTAHVYDLLSNEPVGTLAFNRGAITDTPNFSQIAQLSLKGNYIYTTHGSRNGQPYGVYDLSSGNIAAFFGPSDGNNSLAFNSTSFSVADLMGVGMDQANDAEYLLTIGGIFNHLFGVLRFNGTSLGYEASGNVPEQGDNLGISGAKIVVNPFATPLPGTDAAGSLVFYYGHQNLVKCYEFYRSGAFRRVRKWRWLSSAYGYGIVGDYLLATPASFFARTTPPNSKRYYDISSDHSEYLFTEIGTTGFNTVITLPVGEAVFFTATGPKESPWLGVLSIPEPNVFNYRRYSTPWSGDASSVNVRDYGGRAQIINPDGTLQPVTNIAAEDLSSLFPNTYKLEIEVLGIPGIAWNTSGQELLSHVAPSIAGNQISFVDTHGNLIVLDMASGTWRLYDKQSADTGQKIVDIDDDTIQYFYGFDNGMTWDAITASVIDGWTPASSGPAIPSPQRTFVQPLLAALKINVGDLLGGLALSVGYTEDQFSVSGLADELITGSIINVATPFNDVVSQICALFRVDIVETSGVLRFIRKDRDDEMVIDAELTEADDLVPLADDADDAKVVIKERDVTFEIPSVLELSYIDEANNYGVGMVPVKRSNYASNLTKATGKLTLSVPIIMTTEEAAYWATASLYDIWGGAVTHELRLSSKFARMEPSDYVKLTMNDGQSFVLKFEDVTLNGDLSLSVQSRSIQQYANFNKTIPAPFPVNGDDPVIVLRPEQAKIIDNLLLDYTKNNAGAAILSWFTSQLAALYQDTTLISIGTNTAAIGVCTTKLGTPSEGMLFASDPNSLTFRLPNIAAFSNVTVSYEDWLAGVNAMLVGDTGRWELIFFRNVSVTGNMVTVDTFARGRRGSDVMVGLHTVSDYVVVLPAGYLDTANFGIGPNNIGQTIDIMTVVNGIPVGAAENKKQSFVAAAGSLAPWAPANVRATKNGSDLDITWNRRTRLYSVLHDGDGDTPLDETSEAYDIEIYVANVLKRTMTATAEIKKYLAADMATDGVTLTSTNLTIKVYQRSAVVGRGYAGGGIIHVQ